MAFVEEFASKNSQTASLHLQRNKVLLFVIILIVSLIFWHSIYYFRPMVEFAFMASRQPPQTSIIFGGILQRNPESKQSVWLSVEIGRILMNVNLSSDYGWFENGHGLYHEWAGDASLLADLPCSWCVCDVFEQLVVLMEGMSYFVDGLFFGYDELSVLECFGFKEEADFVRRLQEVFAESVL